MNNFESSEWSQAAWIADNWTSFLGITDIDKVEAQKAIWKIMGVMDAVEGSGKDFIIYNASLDHTNYVTNN